MGKIAMKFEAKSMLNMLCQSLYDTLLVVLRENLQNAYDAVLMRLHEDTSYVDPLISIDVKDGHIVVKDNGIGMSAEEVETNFWTAGKSGKNNDMAKAAGVVGTFGIGAFANFGVCTHLSLSTKKIFSNTRCLCNADREDLDNIEMNSINDSDTEYGTIIDATMDSDRQISAQDALDYITQYVQYLKIPVFFNGELISQNDYKGGYNGLDFFHIQKEHSGLLYSFDYAIDIYSKSPVQAKAFIKNIHIGNMDYEGELMLDTQKDRLFGLRNGFGLSPILLNSYYSFGGIVNMSMLKPTAGREAINQSCLGILQRLMNVWEDVFSLYISEQEYADKYRNFLHYVDVNNNVELARNINIQKANEENEFIKLGDLVQDTEHARFYKGSDTSILRKFSDSDYVIGIVSREYPRRNVQLRYLSNFGVDEIDDHVEVLKIYNLKGYENVAWYSVKVKIQQKLKDEYLITNNRVEFADISHNLPYYVETKEDEVVVYIRKDDAEITNIVKLYKSDYSVFDPLIVDYVRNYIYQQIKPYIPSSSRMGIEAFQSLMKKKKESFSIDKDDLMSIDNTFELFKEGKITIEQFSSIIKKSQQKSQQTLNVNNIVDVDEVVKTISVNVNIEEEKKLAQQQKEGDVFAPLPPILRHNVETKAKLLTTDVESSLLHGYKKFLTLTNAMTKEYYTFFMNPHTTRVIWSMHRIIFVFTLEGGNYTLYYDMELKKHLDRELTGGKMLPTTTIITKNKVFVPIPHELEDYFSLREGSLNFTIHYDSVDGEE